MSRLHCRRCVEFENQISQRAAAGGRQSFFVQGASKHYAPDLPLKLEHVLLDLEIDPRAKTLKGTATQRMRVIAPGQKWMKLDQGGLKIHEVKVDGKAALFEVEGQSLRIRLAESEEKSPAVGSSFEFAVRYETADPKRGIYFTGPDADYPKKRYQVWTQGQDEDAKFWFPTFDYPNQKATSEMIATVPKGFTAVSNGAFLGKAEQGEKTRFHYKLGTPHVTYLITLAVAEFSEWADQGPRGLPVQYFVEPGREADGKRAFSNTPKMIEAFESKIGVPYAYEKYSQVAVQDFIFGGMENTSATTQTDLTLHDERAHLDFSSDALVSHELAHQWFGDLLTCRDWSHGWLNEGFATFLERVWVENNPGPDGGLDEAKYGSYQDLQEYLSEDSGHYRRPIVCNTYLEPIDLFDRHLYQKGGLVLNMLRAVLGEDAFWKSVQLYVSRHRGGSVETIDLIRAIEDATGRNLRRFFDEWVFGAGHPELELSYSWREDQKLAELVIEQKQTKGEESVTENGATTHLFHLPVAVELTLEGGKKIRKTIEIGQARDRIFLAAESKPLMVRFDPGFTIPKTIKFPRPKEMLVYQLKNDADVMGRIEAVQELAKLCAPMPEPDALAAIAEAVSKDSFWGVQAEAAQALAQIRTDAARDALIAAISVRHPKGRRAVAKALGSFKDEKASAALRAHAESDASYYVEAEAIQAWASSRLKPTEATNSKRIEEVEAFVLAQLEKPSYRETIRSFALSALVDLPGIGRGERPRAMSALIDWTRRGKPMDARTPAVMALGRVAKNAVASERARILGVFAELAEEAHFRIRMGLVAALEATESQDAIGILSRIRAIDPDGRVKRSAISAIDHLHAAGTAPESVAALKSSFDKLEEEHRKLKAIVEELQAAKGK